MAPSVSISFHLASTVELYVSLILLFRIWATYKDVLDQESVELTELDKSSFSQLVLHIKGEAHAVPVYSNDDIEIATEKVFALVLHLLHIFVCFVF